jgi:hypothetical protein
MARKRKGETIASLKGGGKSMPRDLSDFEKLLEKAISDPEFASRLMLSPGAALEELNIEVTGEKLRALAECVDPLIAAYDEFGGIRRMIG